MKMPGRRQSLKLAIVVLIVLVLGVGLYFLGAHLEGLFTKEDQAAQDTPVRANQRKTIQYQGQTYALRDGLTSYLIVGVDKSRPDIAQGAFKDGGQADFLLVLVADRHQKSLSQLVINRDTMTDIPVLSALGQPKGTRKAQIALAHAFGQSPEQSALLTRDAVENLLQGVKIDNYLVLSMDGIKAMNDAVGGVTLTFQEDLLSLDPAFKKGETLTLTGDQAEAFVRARMTVGDGTNLARIQRQTQYMTAFLKALGDQISKNPKGTNRLIEDLSDFFISNLKSGRILVEINRIWSYTTLEPDLIQGSGQVNDSNHMEFIPDEASLTDTVLKMFYEQIDIPSTSTPASDS